MAKRLAEFKMHWFEDLLTPDDLEVYDELAAAYEAKKRWPDLVNTLKRKAEHIGDHGDRVGIHLQIASLYIDRFSNQAEAIKAFEAVLELDPVLEGANPRLKEFGAKGNQYDIPGGLNMTGTWLISPPTQAVPGLRRPDRSHREL